MTKRSPKMQKKYKKYQNSKNPKNSKTFEKKIKTSGIEVTGYILVSNKNKKV